MMSRPTFLAHRATVALMAAVVMVATGDGFAQSYAGLYRWALEHHVSGWKADSFPLLVDAFIAVGELGLFALALEGHRLGRRGMAWADLALPFGIATAGWGVSLVFNVGAVRDDFADQATAAVPPVASMLGLLVLLRTLHRLVSRGPEVAAEAVEVHAEPVPVPAPQGPGDALSPAAAAALGCGVEGTPVPEIEVPVPEDAPEDEVPVPEPDPLQVKAARAFTDDIARGHVPGLRRIKNRLSVGQPRAKEVQTYLAYLVDAST